jgi:Zn-dependent alcohol dehydrogenase
MEFKAAVMFEQNKPLELLMVSNGKLSKNQVLIKMKLASICGAQINEITGVKGEDKFLPHMMGHEGYGEVIEVGPNVSKCKVGDVVVLHWRKSSGQESEFPKYESSKGTVGGGLVTTFSEYSVVSQNRMTVVPPEFDPEICTLLGCALSTSYGILKNELDASVKNLIICGAGGIGLSISAIASEIGYDEIVLIDKFPEKESIAKMHGATKFYTSDNCNFQELKMKNLAIIETTGNTQMIENMYDISDKNTVLLVGQARINEKLVLKNPLKLYTGVNLKFTDGGNSNPDIDISEFFERFNSRVEVIKKLITNRYKFTEINEAIEKVRAGSAGRVLIEFA